jgi:hypothetical protein
MSFGDFFSVPVFCVAAAFLYNAITGILGITPLTPKRFWLLLVFGLVLTVAAAWTAAYQKHQGDVSEAKLNGQIGALHENVSEVKTKLNEVSAKNDQMREVLTSIRNAAHIPADLSLNDLAQQIIAKLPKDQVTVKGDRNTTSVGQKGGVTAGTIIGSPINSGGGTQNNTIYIDKNGHRTIPPTVREKAIAALAPGAGTHVDIYYIGTDAEVAQYGSQLIDILNNARWVPGAPNTQINSSYNPGLLGLYVGVKDTLNPPAAAKVLLSALNNSGIPAMGVLDANAKDLTTINLIVGGKP